MHNAPGAYLKCTCLNMLLEQCTFKLCSWSILNLKYYPQIVHALGAAVPGAAAPGA